MYSPEPCEPGQLIADDRFQLARVVSNRAASAVWLAEDMASDAELVWVEIPFQRLLDDTHFGDLLRAEFSASQYSNLLGLNFASELVEANDVTVLVTRPIDLPSLGDINRVIREEGEVTWLPEDIVSWLNPIGELLDELHEAGVVHRDLRPDTIYWDSVNQVILADVCLSAAAAKRELKYGRQLTSTGLAIGTPEYMAPELIVGTTKEATGAADQYSLACTIYELLSGQPPYQGRTPTQTLLSQTRDKIPDLSELRPDLDPVVVEVLNRAFSKDPSKRFGTCGQFAETFEAAALGEPLPVFDFERRNLGIELPVEKEAPAVDVPIVEEPPPRPPRTRVKLAILGTVVGAPVLAVIGFLAYSLFGSPAPEPPAPAPKAVKKLGTVRQRLARKLLPSVRATTLKETFTSIAKSNDFTPRIDEEALAELGISLDEKVPPIVGQARGDHTLHEMIKSKPGLCIRAGQKANTLVLGKLQFATKGNGGKLLPLGEQAKHFPIAERLQLPMTSQPSANVGELAGHVAEASYSPCNLDTSVPAKPAKGTEAPPPISTRNRSAYDSLMDLKNLPAPEPLTAVVDEKKRTVTIATKSAAKGLEGTPIDQLKLPDDYAEAPPGLDPGGQEGAEGRGTDAGTDGQSMATRGVGVGNSEGMPAASLQSRSKIPPLVRISTDIGIRHLPRSETSLGMILLQVPVGDFSMGNLERFPEVKPDETPDHLVLIKKPVWVSQWETTLREFRAVLQRDPRPETASAAVHENGDGDLNRPATFVTWFDAVEFCNGLSQIEGFAPYYQLDAIERDSEGRIVSAAVSVTGGEGFRLPTEAEWEYTCRAGERFAKPLEELSSMIAETAWLEESSGPWLHGVEPVTRHHWQFTDLLGNAAEWCHDWYGPAEYSGNRLFDPQGPSYGEARVHRGGSFVDSADLARPTARARANPSVAYPWLGFRVARTEMETAATAAAK